MRSIIQLLQCSTLKNMHSTDERIAAGMQWLKRAHDATIDGGVAIRYSLLRGWEASYPETTGYIIPTFLRYFDITGETEYRDRAIIMGEWELSIQEKDGSFFGGYLNSGVGKLVFDTGQILFGLINIFELTGDEKYLSAAKRAGDWLIEIQDDDGAWRNFSYHSIPHAYHARVAWPLAELARVTSDTKYANGAKRHFDWVLTNCTSDGWFDNAGFTKENNNSPYTHTIAYTLRGLLEGGLLLKADEYIDAVYKSMGFVLMQMDKSGRFCGSYNRKWEGDRKYSCLTGNAQFSIICSKLYMLSHEPIYFEAAKSINAYLETKQNMSTNNDDIKGAIPGSSPIWGEYERMSCPNWATKFYIDALWAASESSKAGSNRTNIRELLSFKYPG
ncbi:MAG: glycoside hydrolase family 127 protein [Candidatus Brocadiales bacterium]|nr:glycoside hydrolase family 127 protein [Candidatus Brocadiales bacterium]